MINTDDAYGFPPFREMAPSIVIGKDARVASQGKGDHVGGNGQRTGARDRFERLLLGRPDRRTAGFERNVGLAHAVTLGAATVNPAVA